MGHIPDMEILLAGGSTKPAKDLKIGDKVETLHQNTLEKGEHEVTYVRVIESPLLSLNLSGNSFTCAEEDRFYSTNRKGWLHATDLVEGDKISQLDGEVEFKGSTKLGKGKSVELTVDEAHTYICHDSRVLLHNKGGGGGSPPPPPPKTYTQKEVDAMKTQWHTDREAKYDTRLAGQKDLWGAQEGQRKAEYMLEQRNLYDERLGTAKGEWQTAADKRYDTRLGEARTGWHTEAEKRYDTRLGTAKDRWGTEEEKRRATTQEEFNKKYGTLQGQYDTQAGKYGELQTKHSDLDRRYLERGQRYDTLSTEHKGLTGRHSNLQSKYDKTYSDYGQLQGKYDTRGREYSTLQGKHSDLQGKYDTRGGEYDTLRSDYDQRGRSLTRERTNRRRADYGSNYSSAPSTSPGLSSDADRQALLTGDYSFMNTDKGRSRDSRRDDSWRKYL